MKAKYLIFTIFFILIFGNLSAQECEGYFYPYYDNDDPFTVHFQDGSFPQDEIVSWDWIFGDGNISSEHNPSHTYAGEGNYKVTLTVNTGNCTDIYEDSVIISSNLAPDCRADFYYEITGLDFLTVNFFDNSFTSETIDSWAWNFGDGNTSNEQNPVHIYSIDTTYLVSLFVTAGEFSDSIKYVIAAGENFYQGDTCLTMFSYEQLDPSGFTFQFFDGSYVPGDTIQSYLWNFGDGNTSDEDNPVHTYTDVGEYEVTLIIESETCKNSYTSYIFTGEDNWYPEDCQALYWFTINPDNHRKYQFYDFSYGNNQIRSWYWDFGDGNISTQQNPYHEFNTDGIFESSLTIETDSCENKFIVELHVFENSLAGDSLMPVFYPEVRGNDVHFYNLTRGDADNWEWDFGDGNTSIQYSPNHTYVVLGIHEVALSAYKGTSVNTMVIRFNTATEKSGNTNKGIDYAYFYPGGKTNVEIIKSLSFSVYPNPASDWLKISCSNENAILQIYDFTGRIVLEKENVHSEINISNLPAGLYMLKIIDKDISGTVKFIKQ